MAPPLLRRLSPGSLRAFARFDVLLISSAIWFMVQFLRYLFPPLFETLQGQYGVSNTEVGVLFTALMLGYAAMQFPSGLLSDRFGMAPVIAGGVVVFSVASVGVFVAPTFLVVLAAAVLIGVGSGTYKTVGINLMTVVYPERKGFTLGVMDTIGMFGGVVAPAVVVTVLAAAVGWEAVFLVSAAVGLVLAVAFYSRATARLATSDAGDRPGEEPPGAGDGPGSSGTDARSGPDGSGPADGPPGRNAGPDRSRPGADAPAGAGARSATGNSAGTDSPPGTADSTQPGDGAEADGGGAEADGDGPTYLSMFLDPHFLVFVAVNMLFGFGWGGISSFLPLYLVSEKAFSSGAASLVFSGFFLVSVVQVATGELSDRLGQLRILLGLSAVIGAFLVVLLAVASPLVVAASALLVGVGFHGMRPVRDAYFMRIIPRSVGGGVLGLVRSLLLVVTAAAPALVGYVSDVLDFTYAMGIVAGAMVLCALLTGALFVVEPADEP